MSVHKPECRNRFCPGCGHDNEVAKLKQRVVELERANSKLKETRKAPCCPSCAAPLEKKDGTGEGVKHCSECGCGWYILQTSSSAH